MNEKIKELARKAGLEDQVTPFDEFENLELQAFAELIIKECAKLITDTDLEDVEDIDSEVLLAAKRQILQHFGVEE